MAKRPMKPRTDPAPNPSASQEHALIHITPVPAPIQTPVLEAALAAAGIPATACVVGDTLELAGLDETQRPQAQAVADAHPPAAQAEIDRRATVHTNGSTLRTRATDALAANQTFLALQTPTNAQVLAQIRAITRQVNGLIRLELGALDATD